MAQSHIGYEYPLRAEVAPDPLLKPFNELNPPALTLEQLGDDSRAGGRSIQPSREDSAPRTMFSPALRCGARFSSW